MQVEKKLNPYQQAVLDRICAVCIDRRDDGTCGLDADLGCSVKEHLPLLMSMLEGVTSDSLGDYASRVRHNVCSICDQGGEEECERRERIDCPLDRYLGLVVEAIEDVERIRAGERQASAP